MKTITKFIERINEPAKPNLLGRWQITYCKQTLNKRIDLANEDHCGTCYSIKYHNKSYIKHADINNHINLVRYNKYIEIMNAIKENRNKKNAKINNTNPIIDLE